MNNAQTWQTFWDPLRGWVQRIGMDGTVKNSYPLLFMECSHFTVKSGGKLLFDLEGVNIAAAKKGIKAKDMMGQVTEWELSMILRHKELYENTIFHRAGKVIDDPASEGLSPQFKFRYNPSLQAQDILKWRFEGKDRDESTMYNDGPGWQPAPYLDGPQ